MGSIDFAVFPVDPILVAIARRHVEKIEGHNWHAAVRTMQDRLNSLDLARELTLNLLPALKDIMGAMAVEVYKYLYLRAARPNENDVVDWHRESMYGGPPQAFSVWVPVLNVTPDNTLRYIPGSADIPDEELCIEHVSDGRVEQGSDSHKIGLLYAPKRIVNGVDLTKARPMVVPPDHAAVFPGALIHGAARNRTDNIRFSIDFRVVAA